MNCTCSLKGKYCHFDENFITVSTRSYHLNNFQSSQRWKFCQNHISVSVFIVLPLARYMLISQQNTSVRHNPVKISTKYLCFHSWKLSRYPCQPFPSSSSRQSSEQMPGRLISWIMMPGDCFSIVYPRETHKLKSHKGWFIYNIYISCWIALKFCTEHGCAMLCAKFQNNSTTEKWFMAKQYVISFEFKMSVGGYHIMLQRPLAPNFAKSSLCMTRCTWVTFE